MTETKETAAVGLGELLRHLTELLDSDAERIYARMEVGLDYRARYTPILRALRDDRPLSIGDLQQRIRITQGAVSQTVKLMVADGLLRRGAGADRRSRTVALTAKGAALRARLAAEWETHLLAIDALEAEIAAPLRRDLARAIAALAARSFEARIDAVRADSRSA